jgi:ppGpp synthetase/RelA/SpoT-type nucleotidyltranferase
MGLIDEFVARYRREYDFYDQAARLVAQVLEVGIQAAGIRAIVTSRAKSVQRLEAKCRQRERSKGYQTVDDVSRDIVDLAGVRVALYFPGERSQLEKLIAESLIITEERKEFPARSTPVTYDKRFSGYWATHYRVRLRDAPLSDAHKRYADARVEVQVASVLMHAWAEVEHDLVYKPLDGTLSSDELAILDELNGLVMAGEIALERLQRAGESRVAAAERSFANQYDVASHVLSRTGTLRDSALGRMDLLFRFLQRLDLATPERLAPYLEALDADTERRPISEQVVDRLLAEDEKRYQAYEEVRASDQLMPPLMSTGRYGVEPPPGHEAVGHFLAQWRALERHVRSRVAEEGSTLVYAPTSRILSRLWWLDPEVRADLERIRRLRNDLVHGLTTPDDRDLWEAGRKLEALIAKLQSDTHRPILDPGRKATTP